MARTLAEIKKEVSENNALGKKIMEEHKAKRTTFYTKRDALRAEMKQEHIHLKKLPRPAVKVVTENVTKK